MNGKHFFWGALAALCLSVGATGQDKAVTADLTSVCFSTSKLGHAVGRHGVMYRTTDAGKTWQAEDPVTPVDLHSVDFVGTKNGWACGDMGLLLHTDDGGQTWTRNGLTGTENVTDTLHRVVFIGPENGWICGDHGLLLHTEDEGKTWKSIPSNTRHNLEGMAWANSLDGWMVGGTTIVKGAAEDLIMHTSDGGKTWATQVSPLKNDYLRDVCCPSSKVAYAVGDTVLVTRDAGRTWTSAGAHGPFYSVAFARPNVGWAGGAQGLLMATTDGGKTWKRQPSGTTRDILSIFLYDSTQVAVGSARDKADSSTAVLRTEDEGKSWLH